MARPCKVGIDYFPLDVTVDDSIKLIEAEFGLTGFAVVVKLWQKIYAGDGYYCEWTDEVELLFKRDIGLTPGDNSVSEIVGACIRRGIFDRNLYEKYRILTSSGIQRRYFEAVKQRKDVVADKRYLLINPTNKVIIKGINPVNKESNSINPNDNPQSKVNKTKEDKNKISIPLAIESEWKEYVEMRRQIRKPMTEKAKQIALKKLQELGNGNADVMKAILNQSIFNSWQGLFPLKGDAIANGTDKQSDTERILAANPWGEVL